MKKYLLPKDILACRDVTSFASNSVKLTPHCDEWPRSKAMKWNMLKLDYFSTSQTVIGSSHECGICVSSIRIGYDSRVLHKSLTNH